MNEALDALDVAERRALDAEGECSRAVLQAEIHESAVVKFRHNRDAWNWCNHCRQLVDVVECNDGSEVTCRGCDTVYECVAFEDDSWRFIDRAEQERDEKLEETLGALLTLTIAVEQRNLTPREAGACERHGRACAEGQALDEAWDLLGEEAKAEWKADWAVERERIRGLADCARSPRPPAREGSE